MPWCPFAEHVPVSLRESQQRTINPQGLVLHTAVSSSSRLVPSGEVRWHFYCNSEGQLYQFFDTTRPAACQLDGNYWSADGEGRGFLSIETWDGAGTVWDGQDVSKLPPWNTAQAATLARLGAWLHETHGIPLERATGPQGRGIGYHAQFTGGDVRWNTSHACPGPDRIAQVPSIIAAMNAATKPKEWFEDVATREDLQDAVRGVVREEIRSVILDAAHAQVGDTRESIALAVGRTRRETKVMLPILQELAARAGVDIDEEAVAAALAPLLVVNVGGLSDADVAAIAKATNDELARRASAA